MAASRRSLGKGEVVSSILTGSTRKRHCAPEHGDLTALVCSNMRPVETVIDAPIRIRARAYVGIASQAEQVFPVRPGQRRPSRPFDVAMMTLGKLQRINADSDGDTVLCKCSPFAMFPLMPS
jgi:hypothetical protein